MGDSTRRATLGSVPRLRRVLSAGSRGLNPTSGIPFGGSMAWRCPLRSKRSTMQVPFKPLPEIDLHDILLLMNALLVRRHIPLLEGDFDTAACREFSRKVCGANTASVPRRSSSAIVSSAGEACSRRPAIPIWALSCCRRTGVSENPSAVRSSAVASRRWASKPSPCCCRPPGHGGGVFTGWDLSQRDRLSFKEKRWTASGWMPGPMASWLPATQPA
jgi:hypothetical protein